MHTKFWLESLKERDYSEDLSKNWRIRETGLESMDWIHLAQDRDWSQALVNTVMNLQVP
jgi:hypothetical protein